MNDEYHYIMNNFAPLHGHILKQEIYTTPAPTQTVEVEAEEVTQEPDTREQPAETIQSSSSEELCHFIHPSVDSSREWEVHNEIKRLVRRQGIQEICSYLLQMRKDNKVLLPQSPSAAYAELVRMGMPSGEGYNENTFRKYYNNK